MRVSREQMAESRNRILEEAGRLFQAKGFDTVTVAEVMKAAGMTHGGFYGHFKSKDDLIAQALSGRFAKPIARPETLSAFRAAYLSAAHCMDVSNGCPVAALAAETPRQGAEIRQAMAEGIRDRIDHMAEAKTHADPAERRRDAIGSWSAMVGAIILARAADDPAFAEEILRQTRAWIEAGDRP